MLVLTRKRGEKLRIGDNITVMVINIGPNTVRFGIDAPRSVNIARDELPVSPQHELPLEPDGGPVSPPVLAGTERVAPDLRVLGITPQECKR